MAGGKARVREKAGKKSPAKRVNITVPEDDLAAIDRAAARARMSRSAYMVHKAMSRRLLELVEPGKEGAAPLGDW